MRGTAQGSSNIDSTRAQALVQAQALIHARAQSHCAACPKLCRHVCPVADAEKRESVTPWALMSSQHFERMASSTLDPELSEASYHCSACGACERACKFEAPVVEALRSRRAAAFEQGQAPSSVQAVVSAFEARGGKPHQEEPLEPGPVEGEGSSTRWWPDCSSVARSPQTLVELERLLQRLEGVSVPRPAGPALCCGLPLLDAGALDAFEAHAQRVAEQLRGTSRLLVTDSACFQTLRDAYAQVGVLLEPRLESLHARLEQAAMRLPKGVLADVLKGQTLVFWPGCSDFREGYEPQSTAHWLAHLVGKPVRTAEGLGGPVLCSGAGGGLPEHLPEVARAVAIRSVEQLRLARGEVLVLSCARSRDWLKRHGLPSRAPTGVLLQALEVWDSAATQDETR
ncbi:MAG: heterodisulfide reductase-related iron-sulfur binding cluster [Myxococcota bacterium]